MRMMMADSAYCNSASVLDIFTTPLSSLVNTPTSTNLFVSDALVDDWASRIRAWQAGLDEDDVDRLGLIPDFRT